MCRSGEFTAKIISVVCVTLESLQPRLLVLYVSLWRAYSQDFNYYYIISINMFWISIPYTLYIETADQFKWCAPVD